MKNLVVILTVFCVMIVPVTSFSGDGKKGGDIMKKGVKIIKKVAAPASKIGDVMDVVESGHEIYNAEKSDKFKKTAKAVTKIAISVTADAVAVPTAVASASAVGATASTGTAIASLSGAAATSATLAAIGGPASVALGAVGIAVAPAVVGGALLTGAGFAVGTGINWLFFGDD